MDRTQQLEKLRDIILEWNEKINVTAIRDPQEFDRKNVQDSLAILPLPEYEGAKEVLDMGTGGGFPGLPLAVCSPEKSFVLADARQNGTDSRYFGAVQKNEIVGTVITIVRRNNL